MNENPHKVIQNQEMFSKNDPLLIAVSGGLDSMVLCEVLHKLNYTFVIAHCNYQLRIPDANEDQEMIKTWAQSHAVQFFFKTCKLENASNIQEQARNARYDFLYTLLKEHNLKFLLTAHHADDQVENFFLQLSRGSGIKGLKGMLQQSGIHIRPFIRLSKSDLQSYAEKYKIQYREDTSNASSYYLRNFFRNDVIPLIESRIPSFSQMTIRSMDHLQELYPIIQNLFESWKTDALKFVEAEICISKDKVPTIFFGWYLADLEFHPNTIQQIKENLNNSGKLFYSRSHYELVIEPQEIKIRKALTLKVAEEYIIYEASGSLDLLYGKLEWIRYNSKQAINYTNSNTCYFDSNKLSFPLQLRSWLAGDKIQAFGMKGKHKKIQDVFTDKKLGLFEKEKMYLLTSDDTVLWICGLQRSDLAKIDSETTSIIKFTYTKHTN